MVWRQPCSASASNHAWRFFFLLTAFLDDVVVAVPRAIARKVSPAATTALGQAGLTLQPTKCLAWSPTGAPAADLLAEVKWVEDSFVVVGSCLDDHVFAENAFSDLLRWGLVRLTTPRQSTGTKRLSLAKPL